MGRVPDGVAEADAPELAQVVGRLGLADVKDFGLAWDDCEALLKTLGFTAKVEIAAASIAHAAGSGTGVIR